MSNQIQTQLQNQNQIVASNEAAKSKAIEYLSSMGLNLPEAQKEQFIELCTGLNLNPFKREIYAVGYGQKFNIIVGYEVYLKKADMTGRCDGWSVRTEGQGNNLKAIIEIHRKDYKFPFVHEVMIEEYRQDTPIWKSKPHTMLKKVAMAQGFRLAFPSDFGSMPHIAEEYDQTLDQPQPQADPKSLSELKSALEPLGVKLEIKGGSTAKASGAVFNNSTALKSLGFVFDKAQGAWLHNNVSDDIVEAVVEEKTTGNNFDTFDKLEGYINTCGFKISEVKESANGIYFAKLEAVPGMEADSGKLPEGAIQKGDFHVLNVDTLYRAHIGDSQAAESLF
ncbi:recombinase RecT [Helicobacter cinaedi]|uniref:recombinase RecT n=1 Tax=Helicobacter cinaedi TaxID=213 RepID=UPI001057EF82|nr:recombinase RecT [Helicobacter cinaedi]